MDFRIGLGIFCVLLGCNGQELDEPQLMTLGPVTAKGPHKVGTIESSYIGSDGVTVPVQAWYPTADASGTTVTYDDVYPGDSWDFAQPNCEVPHPVVMFSHGNSGVRWQSAFLMDFLASHGFLVVAMDHVTNTFMDQDYSRFPIHTLQRPRDVRESFDWVLEQSADSSAFLSGCADPDGGYAVMGHSFGGYTTYVTAGATLSVDGLQEYCTGGYTDACDIIDMWHADHPGTDTIDMGDERVWAAVGLAPWDAFGVLSGGMSEIDVPTLTLTGTLDETTPLSMVDALVSAMGDQPNDYGKIINTGHFSFSPIACQVMGGDGCGDEFLDVEIVKDLTNQSSTAFLALSLGWDGAAEQFPVESEHLDWD